MNEFRAHDLDTKSFKKRFRFNIRDIGTSFIDRNFVRYFYNFLDTISKSIFIFIIRKIAKGDSIEIIKLRNIKLLSISISSILVIELSRWIRMILHKVDSFIFENNLFFVLEQTKMIDSKLLLLKERKKGRFIFIKKDNWIKDAYWGVQRMQMRFPPRNFLNAFDRRFRQTFEWMGGRDVAVEFKVWQTFEHRLCFNLPKIFARNFKIVNQVLKG